ncbi:GmrSD restriction endonuclease domain-containing protein, partial [Antrihabitans spumae]
QNTQSETAQDSTRDSRKIEVNEHLLDGQQRLTALWRALHDTYKDRTYFLKDLSEDTNELDFEVHSYARWLRGGLRYPIWCDSAVEARSRKLIPISLLNPEYLDKVGPWVDAATRNDPAVSRRLERKILGLRSIIENYNIPYLSLPVTTKKHVALDVFIKMNTSSVRLTAFDIIVAQLEAATDNSLHDLIDDLHTAVPGASRYTDLGNLVLNVAAMRSDRTPSQASYQQLDLQAVSAEWSEITAGIKWAVEILEEEHVYDAQRLPTVAVLPVLAALHRVVPGRLDAAGNARILARAYLWRAFLTRRYEVSAGTRSLQDLRGLVDAVSNDLGVGDCESPIFDISEYALPDIASLLTAGWPKTREILGRGIMAVSLRAGGLDIADGQPARADNLAKREYHHLFPDSLLSTSTAAGVRSYLALNCALISWSTNRTISNKSPLQYLEDRVSKSSLGQTGIRDRLSTHLIPFDELSGAGPYGNGSTSNIIEDYQEFLNARAAVVESAIARLADGLEP